MISVSTPQKILRIVIVLLLAIITTISIRTCNVLDSTKEINEMPLQMYSNKDMNMTFTLDSNDEGTFIQVNSQEETRYVNNFNYYIKEGVLYTTGIYDSEWIQTFTIMPDDILFWIDNNVMLYPVDGYIYL